MPKPEEGEGRGVGRSEKKETGIKIHRDKKKKGRQQIKSEGKRDEGKKHERKRLNTDKESTKS